MNEEEYFENLRGRLIGQRVTLCRLAANSLLIYVGCEPGEEKGLTLWFEPTWHFCGPGRPLVGSRQAQIDDDEPDEKAVMGRIAEPLQQIVGKRIDAIAVERRTFDIAVYFEGDYWVKTFVADPNDDHLWHIRDNAISRSLYCSTEGFEIYQRDCEDSQQTSLNIV
jgi:hypothetical protein